MTMNPSMTVRDEEGNYIGAYEGSTLNPLRDIMTDYNRVRMTRMFSTGYASIEPLKRSEVERNNKLRLYNPKKIPDTITRLVRQALKSGSDAQTAKGFIEYGKIYLFYFFKLRTYVCIQTSSGCTGRL